jgi:hypothetical protein
MHIILPPNNNRALSKLIFGGDTYTDYSAGYDARKEVTPEPATLEVGMTEADFSNMRLGAEGAIIIGTWISHKDKGTLTSLNVSGNRLDAGTKHIAEGIRVSECAVVFI